MVVKPTQSGSNVVVTANGGTTTIGATSYSYQDATQSVLTAFGSDPASGAGMTASGGPVEAVLTSTRVTLTAHGAAGVRTLTLPGNWQVDPANPNPAVTFSNGQWQLNYQGGAPLSVSLVPA